MDELEELLDQLTVEAQFGDNSGDGLKIKAKILELVKGISFDPDHLLKLFLDSHFVYIDRGPFDNDPGVKQFAPSDPKADWKMTEYAYELLFKNYSRDELIKMLEEK